MKRPKVVALALATLCLLAFIFVGGSNFFSSKKLPQTVDVAVDIIIASLPEEDRVRVRNTKRDDLIQYHHGWGTDIRNDFELWSGNEKLLLSACQGKLCHPDDASMIIIEAVWARLQE